LVELNKTDDIGDDADEEKEVSEGPNAEKNYECVCPTCRKHHVIKALFLSTGAGIVEGNITFPAVPCCKEHIPPIKDRNRSLIDDIDDPKETFVIVGTPTCPYCHLALKGDKPHDHTNDSPHLDPANRPRGDY